MRWADAFHPSPIQSIVAALSVPFPWLSSSVMRGAPSSVRGGGVDRRVANTPPPAVSRIRWARSTIHSEYGEALYPRRAEQNDDV
ncbi:hypothetical protein MRX96_015675 [Rhipicephalus microplus]